MREAFRWSVTRKVTKTATVSLFANRYEVDPFLVGKTVELRFEPEDLSVIDVVLAGEVISQAVPFRIGRHVHPKVPQAPAPPPAKDTEAGMSYLSLVRQADDREKGIGHIDYREVRLPGVAGEAGDTEQEIEEAP